MVAKAQLLFYPSISDPFYLESYLSPTFPIHISVLHLEDFLQLLHRIFRTLHGMPRRPLILVNLPVIAPLVGLVAEEVYRRVLDPRQVLLGLEMLQAVGFVPTSGKDIEGDLAAD